MSNIKMFKYEWIWIKNRGSNFATVKYVPMKEHENILVFGKGTLKYNPQMQERTGGGSDRVKYKINPSTSAEVYNGLVAKESSMRGELRVPSSWQKFNTEVGKHPTQKPVALFQYLQLTYTNEGDTILDNCSGSGTTAIAADNIRRNWICIEKDPNYVAVSKKRINENRKRLNNNLFEKFDLPL
jgi:site-specific DNA-methyltransferase (adenine-specific)